MGKDQLVNTIIVNQGGLCAICGGNLLADKDGIIDFDDHTKLQEVECANPNHKTDKWALVHDYCFNEENRLVRNGGTITTHFAKPIKKVSVQVNITRSED